MPTLTDICRALTIRDIEHPAPPAETPRLRDARREYARLAPLAHSRAEGGKYTGDFLQATRELVRAEHIARSLEVQ